MLHVAPDDVGIPILFMPPPTLDSFFVGAASQLYCLMVFPLFCLPLPTLSLSPSFSALLSGSGSNQASFICALSRISNVVSYD